MAKITNIQQYIELVYSEKSPLSNIMNLHEKKIAACRKVGMSPDTQQAKRIMNLEDEKTREQIIDYMCQNESNEFMNLMSDQQLFWDIQEHKMKPLVSTDDDEKMAKAMNLRNTMSVNSKELLLRINESYKIIFKGPQEISAAKKKVNWLTLEQRIKKRDEQRLNQPASVPPDEQPVSV